VRRKAEIRKIKEITQIKEEISMEEVKVIVFGVGAVGKEVTKCLVSKKGVKIVGALGNVSGVGSDLGEVAGIGKKIGVVVTNDPDALFSRSYGDVVIHSVTTHVDETYQQLIKPIERGMNILTAAEEMVNPFVYECDLAAELDSLAKKHGVTILASGLWPTLMDIHLPLTLSGGCREICSIKYYRRSDLRPYVGSIVAKHFGLGITRQEFAKGLQDGTIVGHVGFEGSFETLAYHFGWKLEEVKKTAECIYDEKGYSIAVKTTAQGIVDGQVKIEMELFGSTDPNWETSDTISIEATPPINMVIKPCVVGLAPVANALVNQIPYVMNAEPGIITKPGGSLFAFGGDVRSYIT
jgi:hypothetical protein